MAELTAWLCSGKLGDLSILLRLKQEVCYMAASKRPDSQTVEITSSRNEADLKLNGLRRIASVNKTVIQLEDTRQ